jgi:hypothetical protein
MRTVFESGRNSCAGKRCCGEIKPANRRGVMSARESENAKNAWSLCSFSWEVLLKEVYQCLLKKNGRAMNEKDGEVRRVTSVELLDAAIWREIGSDDPQPPAAFLQALSCLLGPMVVDSFRGAGNGCGHCDVPGTGICCATRKRGSQWD